MPAVTTVNNKFLTKYKDTGKVIKEHANDETKYGGGFQPLPPGVDAICQLNEAKFVELPKDTKIKKADGTSAAGEWQWQCQATIVENRNGLIEWKGQQHDVVVRQVWLFIPYFDTKNSKGVITQEEHISGDRGIMNEMRKLGGPDYTSDCDSPAALVALSEGLTKGKPFFNFATSFKEGTKKPDGSMWPDGVWENWNGNKGLENYQGPDSSAGTEDNTGGTGDNTENHQSSTEEPDLDAMIAAAQSGEDEDSAKLKAFAETHGVSGDDIDAAADWEAVKELIETAMSGGAPAAEEFVPEKDGTCKYAPPDPKDKKKRLKLADCLVQAVNASKKTATVKAISSKVVYKDVPWAELEAA